MAISGQEKLIDSCYDVWNQEINVKGVGSRTVNKLLSKRRFCNSLIGQITELFHYFPQNEGLIFLKRKS